MRMSNQPVLALCCQSGLDATWAPPMSARSKSNGSMSRRISPLLIALPAHQSPPGSECGNHHTTFEGSPTNVFSAGAMICFAAMWLTNNNIQARDASIGIWPQQKSRAAAANFSTSVRYTASISASRVGKWRREFRVQHPPEWRYRPGWHSRLKLSA